MTNQSPYGGGGFPPPWLPNSTQVDSDNDVEWGDALPTQEPYPQAEEPPDLAWDQVDSTETGAGNPTPVSGSQGYDDDATDAREPSVDNERPSDFDAILGAFSGATTQDDSKPKKHPRQRKQREKPKKVARDHSRQKSSRPSTSLKKVRKPVAILVAGLLLLVAIGYIGFNALGATPGASTVEASQAPEVSREVPPGWSKAAAWITPSDVASNLAVRNDHVAYLNSSGVLVVVDGESGETVFSSTPTGANPDESRVVVTQIGDLPVAVVIQDESLTAWPLDQDNPEAKVNEIPASASVSSGGSGVMITTSGETWRMNSSLGMEKVEGLPEDNTSLGMTTDGSIISGSPKGGWGINDGKKNSTVKVEMAEGSKGKVMYPTRASKGIVVAWAPTADKSKRAVGVYNADSGSLIASTTMTTAQVNLGLPLVVTDGGKLASAGPWLIDLERGETETVEGWSTSIGTASELHGKTADGKFVWRGSGRPESVPDGAAIPWGISNERAIIISTDEGGERVIAALNQES